MRTAIIALAFVSAPWVAAQEPYTINASSGQVADVAFIAAVENANTCNRLNAAGTPNCTQAQACTAAGAAGGASCTAAQARAANARIWPATLAGREEYVTFGLAAPAFLSKRAEAKEHTRTLYQKWWALQNTTVRNAECSKIGAPAGCDLGG